MVIERTKDCGIKHSAEAEYIAASEAVREVLLLYRCWIL